MTAKLLTGWKIVRPDGTTHGGYAWPLVNAAAGQKPVKVVADPGDLAFTTGDPCPQFPGDGLCLAETAQAASSGGIRLSECVGLHVTYREADILGQGDGKTRVSRCTVVGIWSPLDVIRKAGPLKEAGMWDADLRYADLRYADLRYANLRYANLRDANLRDADLRYANLRYADLRYANLRDADLRYANLRDANLRDANLRYANLRDANLRYADLRDADLRGVRANEFTQWPTGFDAAAAGVVMS